MTRLTSLEQTVGKVVQSAQSVPTSPVGIGFTYGVRVTFMDGTFIELVGIKQGIGQYVDIKDWE